MQLPTQNRTVHVTEVLQHTVVGVPVLVDLDIKIQRQNAEIIIFCRSCDVPYYTPFHLAEPAIG